jgi:dihydroorotase-like cyclic amidohydrolase
VIAAPQALHTLEEKAQVYTRILSGDLLNQNGLEAMLYFYHAGKIQ